MYNILINMAKGKYAAGKERITVTIEKELLEWLDGKVGEKIFANRSHGFEYLVKRKIEEEENEEK